FQGTGEIQRIFPDEDAKVNRKEKFMKLPVPTPKVFIGYKEPNPMRQGPELLKYELSLNVLLELMFGNSSEAYEKMYENGYIDESFTFDCTYEKGFGFSVISGDSPEPEKIINIVNETITEFKEKTILKEDAQRVIKQVPGTFLSSINSPQFIAHLSAQQHINTMNLSDFLPPLENLPEIELEQVL